MLILLAAIGQLWVIGALILMVLGCGLLSKFCRLLRDRHREQWVELGEPLVFANFSISAQWKVNEFIWRGRYRFLADRDLSVLAVSIKVVTIMVVALVLVGGILWPGES